jgi:hypothetical protein
MRGILVLFGISISLLSSAQVDKQDFVYGEWFDGLIGLQNNGLFEGQVFKIEYKSRDAHQFLKYRHGTLGSITTRTQHYSNVHLFYDLTSNQVLVKNPFDYTASEFILINQSAIVEVEYGDLILRNVQLEQVAGICQVIYSGARVNVYVVGKKEGLIERGEFSYKESKKVYLVKNDKEVVIMNKKNILTLYPDSRNEIKKYLSVNGLILSGKKESDLITVASYLNGLR